MSDSSPVSLRVAQVHDLDALLALEARFPGDRLSPRQMRYHLSNPRACLRILRQGKQVRGYALLLLRRGSRVARLYSIVVDPRARGRGYGVRLLRDAEAQARAAGAVELRLEVRADNAAAVGLYEGRGYRRRTVLPGYYQDGATGWRYGRRLRPLEAGP